MTEWIRKISLKDKHKILFTYHNKLKLIAIKDGESWVLISVDMSSKEKKKLGSFNTFEDLRAFVGSI